MVYVDLNPIRAQLAQTPEESEFTSIYDRIHAIKKETIKNNTENSSLNENKNLQHLLELKQNNSAHSGLDFELLDYLKLVDTTGRILKKGKFQIP